MSDSQEVKLRAALGVIANGAGIFSIPRGELAGRLNIAFSQLKKAGQLIVIRKRYWRDGECYPNTYRLIPPGNVGRQAPNVIPFVLRERPKVPTLQARVWKASDLLKDDVPYRLPGP